MKGKLFSVLLLCIIFVISCSKKNRLTTSTMQIQIEPGSALIGAGSRQQFTATGITPKSGRVTISPIWSVDPVALGEFSVVQGDVTVFTATGSGFGTISASLSDVTAGIEIAVKDNNGTVPADAYGVYSETDRLRLLIDVDSSIGVFSSDNATFDGDAFADITTDVQEGIYAKRTTVRVGTTDAYAGWFIQYGLMGSNDTINMDYYKNGYLKFWVKTPINLEVKIRSSDVDSDINQAKIFLSSISGFDNDNEWHEVAVPLSGFSGVSWNIIKEFFIISSVSDIDGTGGETKTFYVDHIRWTKQ